MSTDDRRRRLDAIIEQFLDEIRQPGSDPAALRDNLLELHADLAAELSERLRVVEAAYRATRSKRSTTRVGAVGAVVVPHEQKLDCPHCGHRVRLVSAKAAEVTCDGCGSVVSLWEEAARSDNRYPSSIGNFRILAKIGEGGFGAAYRALDTDLGRIVAIKIPRAGRFLSDVEKERFLREARSAARLRHPSIVQVHEIAADAELPYIVSDYIDGETLEDLIASQRLEVKETVRILIVVAEATHFAHENGIIHRDLKPSNILLDADRRPFVADFGLARDLDGDITMTVDGELLGTPAYMSPEQASGAPTQVTARSDVHSLGVMLYRMACGELPFRGSKRMLLHQVIHEDPRPPRSVDENVPVDLDTIALKAMSKEPGRRYESALAFADDLRRWLNNEPIRARPIGRLGRLLRWRRRNPRIAALLSIVVILVAAVVIGATCWALRESYLKQIADENARQATARLVRRHLDAGRNAMDSGYCGRSLLWFAEALAVANAPPPTHRIRLAMVRKALPKMTELAALPARATDVAIAPAEQIVVASDLDGNVHLLSTANRLIHSSLLSHAGAVEELAVAPDGKRLAVVLRDNRVVLWDLTKGVRIASLTHEALATGTAFHGGSQRVATSGLDGVARVWNAVDGILDYELVHPEARVVQVKYLPDGRLVTVSESSVGTTEEEVQSELRVWREGVSELSLPPLKQRGQVLDLAWNKEGTLLASSSFTGGVKVFNLESGQLFAEREYTGPARESYLLDDNLIVTLVAHGEIAAYRIGRGESRAVRYPVAIAASAIDSRGQLLVVGGIDGSVAVYLLDSLDRITPYFGGGLSVSSVEFFDDSRRILVGGVSGSMAIWDLAGMAPDVPLLKHQAAVKDICLAPGGKMAITAGADGVARRWDTETGAEIEPALHHESELVGCAISRTGEYVATASIDKTLRIWNATGRPVSQARQHEASVAAVAFSPSEDLVVSGDVNGNVYGWRPSAPDPVFRFDHDGLVSHISFSADGSVFGTSSYDGTAGIHQSKGGRSSAVLQHLQEVQVIKLAVSADGTRVATCCSDHRVRIWDLDGASRLIVELPQSNTPMSATFLTRDRLLTCDYAGNVELWTHDQRDWVHAMEGHHFFHVAGAVNSQLAVACAGRTLATDGQLGNGIALLLDTEDGLPVAPPFQHLGPVRRAVIDEQSRFLLTSSSDHSARLWRIESDDRSAEFVKQHAALFAGMEIDEQGEPAIVSPAVLARHLASLRDDRPELFRCSPQQIDNWQDYLDWILTR